MKDDFRLSCTRNSQNDKYQFLINYKAKLFPALDHMARINSNNLIDRIFNINTYNNISKWWIQALAIAIQFIMILSYKRKIVPAKCYDDNEKLITCANQ